MATQPPPRIRRLALLTAVALASLGFFASSASAAVVTVDLGGEASGIVTSNPAGIDCSNTGGGPPGPDCSFNFPGFTNVELTATPDGLALFDGWTGGAGSGSCASGAVNPCSFFVGAAPISVTAAFDPPPDPPAVATEPATDVRFHRTTLHGRVNPGGVEVEGCRFEYGRTTEYGRTAPCSPPADQLGDGTGDVEVSAVVAPLEPETTYHYRLFAENPGGAGSGDDRTFTTDPAPPDNCSNADIRAAQGIATILLPDCMALEMVSPVDKDGQTAQQPLVSSDGERVRFRSLAALGGTAGVLSPIGDPYVATRGASGWGVTPTSPPAATGMVSGWTIGVDAKSFTPDFSRWLQITSTRKQYARGINQVFVAGIGGQFSPLSPLLVPVNESNAYNVLTSRAQGSSADLSHLYFWPGSPWEPDGPTSYLPGDPVPDPAPDVAAGFQADRNTYVAKRDAGGEPSLALLARDRQNKVWGGSCGTRVGGSGTSNLGTRVQGAVSADGSRAYFSTRPTQPESGSCSTAHKLRILERLESREGPWIGQLLSSECDRVSPACSTIDGDDFYEGASADGTKVYFTTNRQLTDSDLDASPVHCSHVLALPTSCDLYLYDSTLPPGQRLIQVSAGDDTSPTPGAGANVLNRITGISGDGSHVYFVAKGVLTTDPNPDGDTATDGQPNLYLYQRDASNPDGRTAFVGTLVSDDSAGGGRAGLWGDQGTWRNWAYPVPALGTDEDGIEVGGDGHVLLFQSHAPLTDDDGDGGRRDVFRYDAEAETLERISKGAAGGSDNGAFDVAQHEVKSDPGSDFAEDGRWVSEDGMTVVLRTSERLLPGSSDGATSDYLWRDGRLHRLPGIPLEGNRPFEDGPALSHDGSTIAFQSKTRLLPQDVDVAPDIYVARTGGGFPAARPPSQHCRGDECQGPASAPPAARSAPSSSLVGSGNAVAVPRKTLALRVPSPRLQRRRAARSGVVVLRVWANRAGVLRVVARGRIGKRLRRIGRASKRLSAPGVTKVRIRLNRVARKRLRRGRKLKLAIQVRSPGAKPKSVRLALRRAGK